MPDGQSSADQPQRHPVKRLNNVREQAQRLHGRLQSTTCRSARNDATKVQDSDGKAIRDKHDAGTLDATYDPASIKTKAAETGEQRTKRRHDTELATTSTAHHAQTLASGCAKDLTFYPAYCHAASPTYFQWVKLTAHSIHHTLRHHEGYLHSWITQQISTHARHAPQLLFYNNHPIQFVQVIGIVVSVEEWYEKFWLFTIDDSSGATIDVVCRKPDRDQHKHDAQKHKDDLIESERGKEEEVEIQRLSDQVAAEVTIGAILQVKGTITLFQRYKPLDPNHSLGISGHASANTNRSNSRSAPKQDPPTRQLTLERLAVVHDTNKEISLLAARTAFYSDVLDRPWTLTGKERDRLHRQALGEVEHKRKKVRKQAEKQRKAVDEEARDAEQILATYAEEERSRMEEAEKARKAGTEIMERNRERQRLQKLSPGKIHNAVKVVEPQPAKSKKEKSPEQKSRKNKKFAGTTAEAKGRTPRVSCVQDDTSLSFAADDGERSALLRAAFG